MQISNEEAFEALKSYRYLSGNRGETLMGDWSSNYQTWKEFKLNDKYLLIKYEDLVNNTKLTFIKMLEFIHKVTKSKFVLDEDKFLTEYCKAVIKGWTGLKYSYLEELLLVDISKLNPDDELPYNQDNAETLMKNASDFDTWLTETVSELENFTKVK